MSLLKYRYRLQKFDYLVYHKMTGNAQEFANRLGISKSRFYEFLEEIKSMDIPVAYDRDRRSYYYTREGRICFQFHEKIRPLSDNQASESCAGYGQAVSILKFIPEIPDSYVVTLYVTAM